MLHPTFAEAHFAPAFRFQINWLIFHKVQKRSKLELKYPGKQKKLRDQNVQE